MKTRPLKLNRLLKKKIPFNWYYLVWWLGAILIGLVAFLLSRGAIFSFELFSSITQQYPWWPFIGIPIGGIFLTWFMKKVGAGTEGSGIQQTIAALRVTQHPEQVHWFVNLKLATAKFFALIIGIGSGFVIGLEGPTVQIGASIMYSFRRFLPFDNAILRRQLIMMGGAAGIAAAFNAPMAGIMFAFEEMWKNVESKTAARIVLAIILAGLTAHFCNGKETYFGSVNVFMDISPKVLPILLLVVILGGLVGGLFSWLVVKASRWLPASVIRFKKNHPYYFVTACGLLLAMCGLFAPIFGSGAEMTNQLLHNQVVLPWYYMPFKFMAFLLSSLAGVPGGIFSPSLSLGAAVGNCFTGLVDPQWQSLLLALSMIAVLSGVTRAPLTATFIIIEMTNGHSMIFSALIAAYLASNTARVFHVSFYHDLAHRAIKNMPQTLVAQAIKH